MENYDFQEAVLLSDEEISTIMAKADLFIKWINGIQEHALHESVHNGKSWPNYKLVEGRSNRTYIDETIVADKLLKAGYAEELIYTKKLLGITAMEKSLTKPVFNMQLNDLIMKPPGKPTLAPLTDKRPAFDSIEAAKLDFAGVDIDE